MPWRCPWGTTPCTHRHHLQGARFSASSSTCSKVRLPVLPPRVLPHWELRARLSLWAAFLFRLSPSSDTKDGAVETGQDVVS